MKGVVVILLLGMLLISSLVWAGVEARDYSGFDRLVDNVKMFFSFEDGKVRLALEIREREIGSAMNNFENGDEDGALENLERARERLQFVQERVSVETSDDVMASVDEVVSGLDDGISDDFDLYKLEEEKTGLVAELVVEVDGKEGQTLTREIVGDSGGDKVRVVVEGSEGQTRTREIEKRMGEIDVEVEEWIVERTYAKGTSEGGDVASDVVDNVVLVDGVSDVVTEDMTVENKVDPDATPKTPVPTDGSICCKKTKDGETRHHWDSEEDCLNPANIKGEVMDNDVCVALGTAVLNEEDPESWGSVDGGVPEECVAQGAYDDESCGEIMEMLEICCRRTIEGEVVYEWVPGKICVSPYGDREEDDACLG